MPTYEYFCNVCNKSFEVVCPMSAHSVRSSCPACGNNADQTFTKIATQDDHPVWLDKNVRAQIQGDSGPRIETRSELERYCKKNGIVPRN